MNVLIDTNIALNILLKQPSFYAGSRNLFYLAEDGYFTGFISASAITDIFYIAQKALGKKQTKEELKKLLTVFLPATVTDNNIYEALNLDWEDFEDSVQFIIGKNFSADYIVTRNIKDYSSSTIPAIEPEQFLKLFQQDDNEGKQSE
jgi:predicted nucleic acid-binding protein